MSTLEVKAIQAPTGYNLQMPAGHIIQVVQGTTTTSASTTSDTFVDTGLTATITPSATTSTILCFVVHAGSRKHTGDTGIEINLLRDSTQVHSTGNHILFTGSTTQLRDNIAFNYQDSPSSSSAIVYKTQFKSTNNTNGVSVQTSQNKSTMILMEVAG